MKGRYREVEELVQGLPRWAARRPDLRGIAVVGSYASRRAGMSSDLDQVLLSTDPVRYGPWLEDEPPFGPARHLLSRSWGPVIEWRFRRRTGLILDVGVTPPVWAAHPLDPGTARVLADGLRIDYDPDGQLGDAARESQSEASGPADPGSRCS